MSVENGSFVRLDVPALAKIADARPDQVAKAGAALFSALTSGSVTSERLTNSAANKAGLDPDQMQRILGALEEGFRRPESLQTGFADRIESASHALGDKVADTVEEMRSRASSIDLSEAKDMGAKALKDVRESVAEIDLESIKGRSRKLGDALAKKAGGVADSVSEALRRAQKKDDNEK